MIGSLNLAKLDVCGYSFFIKIVTYKHVIEQVLQMIRRQVRMAEWTVYN